MNTIIETLRITSIAFENNGRIPKKYSFDGENINPSLTLAALPPGTMSLAVIMEDPDTDRGTFDHWLVWNIRPEHIIPENYRLGVKGMNGTGKLGYTGPKPPSGIHRYFFKLYSLDKILDLREGADKKMLLHVMRNRILAAGEIVGLYGHPNSSL